MKTRNQVKRFLIVFLAGVLTYFLIPSSVSLCPENLSRYLPPLFDALYVAVVVFFFLWACDYFSWLRSRSGRLQIGRHNIRHEFRP